MGILPGTVGRRVAELNIPVIYYPDLSEYAGPARAYKLLRRCEMTNKLMYSVLVLSVLWPLGVCSEAWSSQASSPPSAVAAIKPFLGRWDLSIKTPKGELPSWVEVSEEQGQPKVVMVGVSEHATPLAKVELKEGEIEFLS